MNAAPYYYAYEITVGDGDALERAQAEDLDGALIAAATLCNDGAERGGSRTLLRRSVRIYKDGRYDGLATTMAQAGDRQ